MKFIKNTKIMTEKRPFAMCVYGTSNACHYYETSRWYSFFARYLLPITVRYPRRYVRY